FSGGVCMRGLGSTIMNSAISRCNGPSVLSAWYHVRPVCLQTGKLILSCLSASLTFCPGIFFWNVSHPHSIQVFSCPLPWLHARQPPRHIPAVFLILRGKHPA